MANDREPPARPRAVPTEPLSLAAEAGLLRAIITTATEGIVTMQADGRIVMVNRAAELMFGYAPAELLGQDVTVLMPPPYADEHVGYVRNYLETGLARIIGSGREVVAKRQDGSEFPIDLSVGEGVVDGRRLFVAILRDISERKRLQAKLSLSERLAAIGELAAGVAHEINNPTNTILNCAQLILDGDDPKEHVQLIAEEGTRIANIVSDLLQFARSERRESQPTDLADLVNRTVRLVREVFLGQGVAIELEFEADVPAVMADRSQLQQVLLNLLNNARDAVMAKTSGPRVVLVRVAREGEGAAFVVRDTGPGVPPMLGDRIFEPFFTTKRARGGTGLGLSISRSIVDGLGGALTLTSQPGQGAEFRAWIPTSRDRTG